MVAACCWSLPSCSIDDWTFFISVSTSSSPPLSSSDIPVYTCIYKQQDSTLQDHLYYTAAGWLVSNNNYCYTGFSPHWSGVVGSNHHSAIFTTTYHRSQRVKSAEMLWRNLTVFELKYNHLSDYPGENPGYIKWPLYKIMWPACTCTLRGTWEWCNHNV